MRENGVIAARIRRLREETDLSRRAVAQALRVDVTAVAGWESGRYLPRVGHRAALAALLGLDKPRLFADSEAPCPGPAVAELVDTEHELGPLLLRLASEARVLRAVRIAAPYPSASHVQTKFRALVAERLSRGELTVQRVEIFYGLPRLKEALSNILRYDGRPYHLKSYCAGLTEAAPAFGGYYVDDEHFLIGAYWATVLPQAKPGLHLRGEPFRAFFAHYWAEIWSRGLFLNIQGRHNLDLVRDLAVRLGLPSRRWPRFVREAEALDIGDGAPPLI